MLKDLLNQLTRSVSGALGVNTPTGSTGGGLGSLINKLGQEAQKKDKTFTFNSLPVTLEELKALPEAGLQDVYAVAALSAIALTRYEAAPEECFRMLDFLKGPDPMSPMEKSAVKDRFMDGKFYKVRSFFEGATPANNYTPQLPYRIKVASNPYSFQNEGWATLWLQSGGADDPRPVRLRKKPSTGQWFLVEIQYLGDIRTPAAEDKWR